MPVRFPLFIPLLLLIAGVTTPLHAAAQDAVALAAADPAPADTFLDPRARSLFSAARERWLQVDSSIRSYEAIIQSRAVVSIRAPLKYRTLFRAEAATRVRWSADSALVLQMLAANEVTPEGPSPAGTLAFSDAVFDPTGDRLYFGFGDDDDDDDDGGIQFEHPIAPGSEGHYRYQVTDSLRLSLPDSRTMQAVGLEIIPRQRSGRLLSGILWIDPSTGAVIRALYRLATEFDIESELGLDDELERRLVPGMFRPFEFDISMVVVEYSFWDFQYWLPNRIRMEGFARAGILKVPGSYEQSYRILDVVGADDPAAIEDAAVVAERWRTDGLYGEFRELEQAAEVEADSTIGDGSSAEEEDDEPPRFILVPVNHQDLHTSELLPPPIWDEAPGFASEDRLADFVRDLANLSVPDADRSRFRASWGPEIGDLFRYNRVEGPSVGARAEWTTATGIGAVGLEALGWLGIGSWVPDARLGLSWESARRRLSFSGYHRVEEVDPRARNLAVGNSLTALFFGRDDGDYFRASGARLRWEPDGVRRGWYHLTLSAEEHRALSKEVDFSVAGLLGGDDTPFRPSLEAEQGTEFAAALGIEPWWGTDPRGPQGGGRDPPPGCGGGFPLVSEPRGGADRGTCLQGHPRRTGAWGRPDLGRRPPPTKLVPGRDSDAQGLPGRLSGGNELRARQGRAGPRGRGGAVGGLFRLGLARGALRLRPRRGTSLGWGRPLHSGRAHKDRSGPGGEGSDRLAIGAVSGLGALEGCISPLARPGSLPALQTRVQPPSLSKRPTQKELDLSVHAPQFIICPATQGLETLRVDADQKCFSFEHCAIDTGCRC